MLEIEFIFFKVGIKSLSNFFLILVKRIFFGEILDSSNEYLCLLNFLSSSILARVIGSVIPDVSLEKKYLSISATISLSDTRLTLR